MADAATRAKNRAQYWRKLQRAAAASDTITGPTLTLDPFKATLFRDPKTGERHDRKSPWGQKCRTIYARPMDY
jgi:hypothetical protein